MVLAIDSARGRVEFDCTDDHEACLLQALRHTTAASKKVDRSRLSLRLWGREGAHAGQHSTGPTCPPSPLSLKRLASGTERREPRATIHLGPFVTRFLHHRRRLRESGSSARRSKFADALPRSTMAKATDPCGRASSPLSHSKSKSARVPQN